MPPGTIVSCQIQVIASRTTLRLCTVQSSPLKSSPAHLPHKPTSQTDIGTAPNHPLASHRHTRQEHAQVLHHCSHFASHTHTQVDSGRSGWLHKPASCTQVNIHTKPASEPNRGSASEIFSLLQTATLAVMLRSRKQVKVSGCSTDLHAW